METVEIGRSIIAKCGSEDFWISVRARWVRSGLGDFVEMFYVKESEVVLNESLEIMKQKILLKNLLKHDSFSPLLLKCGLRRCWLSMRFHSSIW